ncbi:MULTISPECIES: S41 family peptidase [Bacillaceae]|uniref:S41 family peptidase n=1 Tax=Bacillaceae TaxID=186817 RepID=UPI000BFBD91C|nr:MULTISPECIES: S41 family peptidase [Bacillaceae]PGT74839.1 peptidase S41 [Bacillus sp. AFS040349]UGB29112.1 S41 family peptidase [Metabacillus sp. B2-18]
MKNSKLLISVIVTAIITAGITYSVVQPRESVSSNPDDPFSKLRSTYDILQSNYYKDVDTTKLVEGAIKGMVDSLEDPYSVYMDVEEAKSFSENISSSFEGIGAEIQESNGSIMIVSPIKGSPAEEVGLKPKDVILKVNDESVEGLSVNEAVLKIRGEKGTKVNLLVQRAGVGELTFTITRDTIPLETVYYEVIEDNIGKIQITKFSETTGEELSNALKELQGKNVKGLVLDLRQNPGGLMDQALLMSDLFVDKGENILQVEDRTGAKEVYKAENNKVVTLPVTVIIDGGTASAGEIMAAALHQSAGIPLVGEKTFGKGTVQTAKAFDDSSSVKYTTAKWLTPDGSWIHEKGIEPTVKVELPAYANLPYINPDNVLKLGDSTPEVNAAQQMLKALGYNDVSEKGYFDANTENVVKQFQEDQGLTVDGEITKDTTIKIIELIQNKIKDNDTQLEKAISVLKEQL